ncbi:MAG TPA: 2-phospho-L-lactate transferase CofD family protein, partial [Terriglobales bacterium]|nr:2-phospho-L-lactate transferase CofD family protein [Terriglobales bacterium]
MPELSRFNANTPDQPSDPALRVVVIGGGTGLSTLLRGLKRYVVKPGVADTLVGPAVADLCAVVTVTDDGGSSGLLRKEFNILPPGDIRNCIVA